MKFLRNLVITLAVIGIGAPTLMLGALEGGYYYELSKIEPVKHLSDVDYSKQLQEIMWVATTETGEISMDKLSATGFVYRTFTTFGEDAKGPGLQGFYIALNLAESLLNKRIQADSTGDDRLKKSGMLSIWVTKNYTATEAINAMINWIHLGNDIYGADNAAEFYFNKPVESLDLSENLVLGVLSYWPDLATICEHEKQLELSKQAKLILENLKINFPDNYKSSEFASPEYSNAAKAGCSYGKSRSLHNS